MPVRFLARRRQHCRVYAGGTTWRLRSFVAMGHSVTRVAPALLPVPGAGQVVSVRGATWAVTQAHPHGMPRSPADEQAPSLTHVVYCYSPAASSDTTAVVRAGATRYLAQADYRMSCALAILSRH